MSAYSGDCSNPPVGQIEEVERQDKDSADLGTFVEPLAVWILLHYLEDVRKMLSLLVLHRNE